MKSILILDKVLLHNTKQKAVSGAELFNLAFSADLAKMGFKQTILAATSWKKQLERFLPKYNIEYKYLPPVRVAWINALLGLTYLVNKKFDYVISTNVGDAVIAPTLYLAKRKSFKKLIIIAHRTPSDLFLNKLRNIQPTIISVNQIISQQFQTAGYNNAETYYGIIGAENFFPKSHAAMTNETRFVVFGSLDSPWKGADTAIGAFLALPAEVQANASLHLAGYANGLPQINSNRIKAYSWIPKDQVAEFLRTMDIMLVPSRDTDQMKETFSQSIVQGMLTGLPILARDIPVLSEKLDAGGGFIFNNQQELTELMLKLYANKNLSHELGKKARETALARYTWDTTDFVERFLN